MRYSSSTPVIQHKFHKASPAFMLSVGQVLARKKIDSLEFRILGSNLICNDFRCKGKNIKHVCCRFDNLASSFNRFLSGLLVNKVNEPV